MATSGGGSHEYPLELIKRPLTLPAGMAEINVAGTYIRMKGFDATIGVGGGIGYGITDQLDLGVVSGYTIKPDAAWSKEITPTLRLSLMDTDKLDLAAGVSAPINLNDGADKLSEIDVDLLGRYLLSDNLAITFGEGLLPIGIKPSFALALNLNVGILFQMMPNLALDLTTQIAHIKLKSDTDANVIFGKDAIPVDAMFRYSLNPKFDILVGVDFPDLKNSKLDLIMIMGGVSVRL